MIKERITPEMELALIGINLNVKEREVELEQAEQYAQSLGSLLYETNLKENINISEPFVELSRKIYFNRKYHKPWSVENFPHYPFHVKEIISSILLSFKMIEKKMGKKIPKPIVRLILRSIPLKKKVEENNEKMEVK